MVDARPHARPTLGFSSHRARHRGHCARRVVGWATNRAPATRSPPPRGKHGLGTQEPRRRPGKTRAPQQPRIQVTCPVAPSPTDSPKKGTRGIRPSRGILPHRWSIGTNLLQPHQRRPPTSGRRTSPPPATVQQSPRTIQCRKISLPSTTPPLTASVRETRYCHHCSSQT